MRSSFTFIHITSGLKSSDCIFNCLNPAQSLYYFYLSYDILFSVKTTIRSSGDSIEKRTHPINHNELEFIPPIFQRNQGKSNQTLKAAFIPL